MKKDIKGFSLLELIVVIGIMGILAGVSVFGIGYIQTGKTKKSSMKLNAKFDTVQTDNMTKKGDTYLYLYQTDDGIFSYICQTDSTYPNGFTTRNDLDSYLSSKGETGSDIADNKVKLTAKSNSGTKVLNNSNMLKVGYDKGTGAFTQCNSGSIGDVNFCSQITLSGKQTYTIKLVKLTGKHFVKEG